MAEFLSTISKTNPQKGLTELDMAAVQQLMQLSDEDSNNNEKRCSKRDSNDDQSRSEITSALIEEIFGKEDRGVSFEEEKKISRLVWRLIKILIPSWVDRNMRFIRKTIS
ncbi:hypothetical protein ACB094_02G139000 [Castanea mollissima]